MEGLDGLYGLDAEIAGKLLAKRDWKKELGLVVVDSEEQAVGQAAADVAEKIGSAIASRGVCVIAFSVSAPSSGLFEALLAKESIEWKKVIAFP